MRLRVPLIPLLVAHLILFLPGQAFPDESDPVFLRKQMHKHIDAQRWKEAERFAKKLKSKVGREDKKEVQEALKRIQGELAWQRSSDRIARTKDLAKQLDITNAFLKKYGRVPEVATKAIRRRDDIIDQLFVVISDFEGRADLPRGLKRVNKSSMVRNGKQAARIEPGSAERPIRVEVRERDWSPHRALCIWVHAKEKKGSLHLAAHTTAADCFQVDVPIDWTGWKEVRIPLGSDDFKKIKQASWKNIADVRIHASNDAPSGIVIDHLRVERTVK